jgi:hypothetical protein
MRRKDEEYSEINLHFQKAWGTLKGQKSNVGGGGVKYWPRMKSLQILSYVIFKKIALCVYGE